eukprot:gene6480-biopygen1113
MKQGGRWGGRIAARIPLTECSTRSQRANWRQDDTGGKSVAEWRHSDTLGAQLAPKRGGMAAKLASMSLAAKRGGMAAKPQSGGKAGDGGRAGRTPASPPLTLGHKVAKSARSPPAALEDLATLLDTLRDAGWLCLQLTRTFLRSVRHTKDCQSRPHGACVLPTEWSATCCQKAGAVQIRSVQTVTSFNSVQLVPGTLGPSSSDQLSQFRSVQSDQFSSVVARHPGND